MNSTRSTSPGFVTVRDGRFSVLGRPHRFVGANLWCAAYLGARAPIGDRDRLRRELDRLRAAQVTNLRVLAVSELSPLRSSVRPAFHDSVGHWSQDLLEGLDFAMAEMNQREQRAVLYLTNFWEWSGGMMTYLSWANGGSFVDIDDSENPWIAFADFAACFYGSREAVALYHDALRSIVQRENSITGQRYVDDPTLFAWQLANEPRPGATSPVVAEHFESYCAWIRQTAALLKSLDPNHLVSTGSEGLIGSGGSMDNYSRAHDVPEIDYLTAHIWPQNWNWVAPDSLEASFPNAARLTREYLESHIEAARRLGRPLVIEEFGFPRDHARFDSDGTTILRNRFYRIIQSALIESAKTNGPLSGTNFWAFGGEGRAAHADLRMRPGEGRYTGDPPHEPQGWYSVFDTDSSTLAQIKDHALELSHV